MKYKVELKLTGFTALIVEAASAAEAQDTAQDQFWHRCSRLADLSQKVLEVESIEAEDPPPPVAGTLWTRQSDGLEVQVLGVLETSGGEQVFYETSRESTLISYRAGLGGWHTGFKPLKEQS